MVTYRDVVLEKLKHVRQERNLTQEEFGKLLNVSRMTVIRWEKGQREPELNTLAMAVSLFNIDISPITTNVINHEELPSDEKRLLFIYRALNADGKKYILECAENASEVSRYKSEQKEALA